MKQAGLNSSEFSPVNQGIILLIRSASICTGLSSGSASMSLFANSVLPAPGDQAIKIAVGDSHLGIG